MNGTVISYWETVSWSKFNTLRLEQSHKSKKDAVKRVAEKEIRKKARHKKGKFGN